MEQSVVKATSGRATGSRASRRMRAEGLLPGVVYGMGKDPQAVSVQFSDLRAALTTSAGMNAVLTLDIEGATETVLVRDVQRDPIKRLVTHADFLRVDPNEKVRLHVPIEMVGEPKAVLEAGGLIEQMMFELEVEVAPNAIPESIEADVSDLTLDGRIQVGDLALPAGVSSTVEESISVIVPVISRAAKVGDEDEDGLEADLDSDDGSEDADAEGATGDEEE